MIDSDKMKKKWGNLGNVDTDYLMTLMVLSLFYKTNQKQEEIYFILNIDNKKLKFKNLLLIKCEHCGWVFKKYPLKTHIYWNIYMWKEMLSVICFKITQARE